MNQIKQENEMNEIAEPSGIVVCPQCHQVRFRTASKNTYACDCMDHRLAQRPNENREVAKLLPEAFGGGQVKNGLVLYVDRRKYRVVSPVREGMRLKPGQIVAAIRRKYETCERTYIRVMEPVVEPEPGA